MNAGQHGDAVSEVYGVTAESHKTNGGGVSETRTRYSVHNV